MFSTTRTVRVTVESEMTSVALPGDPLRPPPYDSAEEVTEAFVGVMLNAIAPDSLKLEPALHTRSGARVTVVEADINGVRWTLSSRVAFEVASVLWAANRSRPATLPTLDEVAHRLSHAAARAVALGRDAHGHDAQSRGAH